MSAATNKLPLGQAQDLAGLILSKLAPACERIEIAGSIRRRRPEVGDVEIVAIPKLQADLLGEAYCSLLDERLERMCGVGWFTPIKGGPLYKQYDVADAEGNPACKLDLFITSAEAWGCIFALRTGPAEFSKRLVTARQDGGLRPPGVRFLGGRLVDCRSGKLLDTPEEKDVFEALGLAWIPPEERR